MTSQLGFFDLLAFVTVAREGSFTRAASLLVKACSTSVGQKLLMAISGLLLCGFLVAHLGGNLKLYAGEQSFNDYAHALHGLGPVLAAAEIGLFVLFLLHIGLAISVIIVGF